MLIADQGGKLIAELPLERLQSRLGELSFFGAAAEEATLRRCQELDVERVVFAVPSEEREKVLPLLDQYAAFIPRFA